MRAGYLGKIRWFQRAEDGFKPSPGLYYERGTFSLLLAAVPRVHERDKRDSRLRLGGIESFRFRRTCGSSEIEVLSPWDRLWRKLGEKPELGFA
jgi:hypothetical protein